MKKHKGITLIALVITIIVLLILAGVALSLVAGNEGILEKAEKATEITRASRIVEVRDLWITEKNMDNILKTNDAKNLPDVLDDLESQDLINLEERTQIEEYGYITIDSENISFTRGIEPQYFTITSSKDNVEFTKTIKVGDIIQEKPDYTTYSIEGISTSKDGEFVTQGSVNGKAGMLEIVGDIQNATFKYTLTNFMQGDEKFFVKVNIDGEEYFQELNVIQGNEVIYQEDFVGITYEVGTDMQNILDENDIYTDGKAKYIDTTNTTAKINFSYKGSECNVLARCNGYLKIEIIKDGNKINEGRRSFSQSDLGQVVNLIKDYTEELESNIYNVNIAQAKKLSNASWGTDLYVDAIVIYR